MKKKYNTLNEEVNRIKTLFTEERLYGNIVDKSPIIVEQRYKKLIKALSPASAVLKGLDTKRITRFTTDYFDIKSFGDALKHLEGFPTIWVKVMGNNGVNKLTSAKRAFKYIENVKAGKHTVYKNLKEIPEEVIDDLTIRVTRQGGLRDQFIDLIDNARGSKSTIGVEDIEGLVLKNKNGVHTIHIKNKNTGKIEHYKLGGEEPKKIDISVNDQYAIDDVFLKRIENKKKVEAEKKRVEAEKKRVEAEKNKYKDSESSLDSDLNTKETGIGSPSKTKSDPVSTKNPNKVKKEVLEIIDLALLKASKKSPKKITLRQLEDLIKSKNGFVIVKMKDGKTRRVDFWKEYEVELTTIKGEEVVTGYTLKKEGTFGGSDSKTGSWVNKQIQKLNKTPTQNKKFWGDGLLLRYLFPQTSWFLRKVTWPIRFVNDKLKLKILPPLGNQKRYSIAPGPPIPSKWNEVWKSAGRKGEVGVRLMAEQFFFVTAYGLYKQYERGDVINLNPFTNWKDFYDGEIWKWQPIAMAWESASSLVSDEIFWEQLRTECVTGCEGKGIESSKVLTSGCYKKCMKKVEDLKSSVERSRETLQEYASLAAELEDINNMGEDRVREFCDGEEKGKLKEKLINLRDAQVELKKKYNKIMSNSNIVVTTIAEVTKSKLKNLGLMDDKDEVLLQYEDGNKLTISSIDNSLNEIDEVCANIESGGYKASDDLPGKSKGKNKTTDDLRDKSKGKNKEEGEDNRNVVFYAEATQFELYS